MNVYYFRKLLFAVVLLLCGTVANAHDFVVGDICSPSTVPIKMVARAISAAGFDLQRGEVGSQAKHMDPAVYNAIKAEEAKLIAEKDGLVMQKEVLEDEVDTLQSKRTLWCLMLTFSIRRRSKPRLL